MVSVCNWTCSSFKGGFKGYRCERASISSHDGVALRHIGCWCDKTCSLRAPYVTPGDIFGLQVRNECVWTFAHVEFPILALRLHKLVQDEQLGKPHRRFSARIRLQRSCSFSGLKPLRGGRAAVAPVLSSVSAAPLRAPPATHSSAVL